MDGCVLRGAERSPRASPTRRSSDLQNHGYEDLDLPIGVQMWKNEPVSIGDGSWLGHGAIVLPGSRLGRTIAPCPSQRSEEHTSELQSRQYLVRRLLLEKKK